MRSSDIPAVAFALLTLTIIGLTAYYLPMLPDQIATHFGPGGRPNGWHNHAGFINIVSICIALAAVIFLSGALVDRLPDVWINIPNKGYWLAPGRRDDTLAFVRSWLHWMGVLILGNLTLVVDMGLRANLTPPSHFPDYAPWVVATGASLMAAMVIGLVWRFR
jgi:Protein of unknown function (DUF1648)